MSCQKRKDRNSVTTTHGKGHGAPRTADTRSMTGITTADRDITTRRKASTMTEITSENEASGTGGAEVAAGAGAEAGAGAGVGVEAGLGAVVEVGVESDTTKAGASTRRTTAIRTEGKRGIIVTTTVVVIKTKTGTKTGTNTDVILDMRRERRAQETDALDFYIY